MLKRAIAIAVVLTLSVLGRSASADPIIITGDTAGSTEGLGNFQATMTYTSTSSTAATLIIEIQNTSPAANGGFLTGFVFNNPGNSITGATLSSTDSDFSLLGGSSFDNSINGSPFGQFDIGAATGGDFEGGGNPSDGIAVGATETFTFSLTGTMLDTLSEESFVSELSSPPGAGSGTEFFLARFRGFNDGGSDKVPGNPDGNGEVPIPEPASILMWGLGLVGAAGFGRWRRR